MAQQTAEDGARAPVAHLPGRKHGLTFLSDSSSLLCRCRSVQDDLQGWGPAEGGDVALPQPLPEQNVLDLAIATDLTSLHPWLSPAVSPTRWLLCHPMPACQPLGQQRRRSEQPCALGVGYISLSCSRNQRNVAANHAHSTPSLTMS